MSSQRPISDLALRNLAGCLYEMRKLIGVDLLIIDDFALQPLDATETADIYELCVERHHSSATVLTSNRDPIGPKTRWPRP